MTDLRITSGACRRPEDERAEYLHPESRLPREPDEPVFLHGSFLDGQFVPSGGMVGCWRLRLLPEERPHHAPTGPDKGALHTQWLEGLVRPKGPLSTAREVRDEIVRLRAEREKYDAHDVRARIDRTLTGLSSQWRELATRDGYTLPKATSAHRLSNTELERALAWSEYGKVSPEGIDQKHLELSAWLRDSRNLFSLLAMAQADPGSIAPEVRHELREHLYAALEREGQFGCRAGDTLSVLGQRLEHALMLKASRERTAEHAARSVTKYMGLDGFVGTSDRLAEYTRGKFFEATVTGSTLGNVFAFVASKLALDRGASLAEATEEARKWGQFGAGLAAMTPVAVGGTKRAAESLGLTRARPTWTVTKAPRDLMAPPFRRDDLRDMLDRAHRVLPKSAPSGGVRAQWADLRETIDAARESLDLTSAAEPVFAGGFGLGLPFPLADFRELQIDKATTRLESGFAKQPRLQKETRSNVTRVSQSLGQDGTGKSALLEVVRKAASLPPSQGAAFLRDLVTLGATAKSREVLVDLVRATLGARDAEGTLRAAHSLLTRPGIDAKAIEILARKAREKTISLTHLEAVSLAPADFNDLALNKATKWDRYRLAVEHPSRGHAIDVAISSRGAAGEIVFFRNLEAYFPGAKIEGRNVRLTGAEVDGVLRGVRGQTIGVEVKAGQPDTWQRELSEWGKLRRQYGGNVPVDKLPSQLQRMVKQLSASKRAHDETVLIMTDKAYESHGEAIESLVLKYQLENVRVERIPERDVAERSRAIRNAFGLN